MAESNKGGPAATLLGSAGLDFAADYTVTTLAASPPASPTAGQIAFETSTLRTFQYTGSVWAWLPRYGGRSFAQRPPVVPVVSVQEVVTVEINRLRETVGQLVAEGQKTNDLLMQIAGALG